MDVCEDLATKMLTTALHIIEKKKTNPKLQTTFFFFYSRLLSRESYNVFRQ